VEQNEARAANSVCSFPHKRGKGWGGGCTPALGATALYGLAIENQNGWIGHHGNIMSYMAYPYYLPAERITMVVLLNSGVDVRGSCAIMQDITRIISPNNRSPGLAKQ
jgi:D-alanyl-D-alanine carboxypeptidase